MQHFRAFLGAAALSMLAFAPSAAADSTLDAASQRLQAGAAEEALAMLVAVEPERAGQPDFDLLLGRAALAAGRPGLAMFALERVIAVEPDNAAARLEYARAYAAAGYRRQARSALGEARSANPDAEVARAIDALALELRAVRIGVRRGLRAYLQASGGYDTNITGATDDRFVFGVPGPVSDRFLEQDDGFVGAGGGIDYQAPAFGQWDVIIGGRGRYRSNVSSSDFDFGTFDGYAGLLTARGADEWSGTVNVGRIIRDGDGLHTELGVNLRWRHAFSARQIGTVYFGASTVDFDVQDRRDGDRLIGGVRYTHGFGGELAPVAQLGAYVGSVDTDTAGSPQLEYNRYGLRAAGQLKIHPQVVMFGAASIEQRDYDGPVVTSVGDREDTTWRVSGGVHVRPADGWRITPGITYRRNDSNAALSDHDQTLITLTVRREFN